MPKRALAGRAHLRVFAPGSTVPFEEMSQRWRAIGNTVSTLIDLIFEPRILPVLETNALPLDQLAGRLFLINHNFLGFLNFVLSTKKINTCIFNIFNYELVNIQYIL